MDRRTVCTAFTFLALVSLGRAQDPGFGYATDTNNQIVSVNLTNGQTQIYSGQTLFPANALGYTSANGADGSVIYSSNSTVGQLAVWNRATNTHTALGNITSTTSGYANPYSGTSVSDAAYWNGVTTGMSGTYPTAGYYIVSGNRGVYRVDFNDDGTTNHSITSIANVTLVATIPTSYTPAGGGATVTLTSTFGFGDIAFSPTGLLYLSDSSNGLFTFNITTGATSRVSPPSPILYPGQIAFGLDGKLYGVGNSAGTPSTQGNDFYSVSTTDGSLTAIATNTDPGNTYRDFSGAAGINVVPEPDAFACVLMASALGVGAVIARRRQANA